MHESVKHLLRESNLVQFEDRLEQLGVVEDADVLEMNDSDVEAVGMSKIQHRRLCRHVALSSSTGGQPDTQNACDNVLSALGLSWRALGLIAAVWIVFLCGVHLLVVEPKTADARGGSGGGGGLWAHGPKEASTVVNLHDHHHQNTDPAMRIVGVHTIRDQTHAHTPTAETPDSSEQHQHHQEQQHQEQQQQHQEQQQQQQQHQDQHTSPPPSPSPATSAPPTVSLSIAPQSSLTPENMCVSWRQTGGCKPSGSREPQNDLACDKCVPPGASGYCECANGQKAASVDCQHNSFTCKAVCESTILVKPLPKECEGQQPVYEAFKSAHESLGAPLPVDAPAPQCAYGSHAASWDPWGGASAAACTQSPNRFTVSASPTEIIITHDCAPGGDIHCTLGKSNFKLTFDDSKRATINLEGQGTVQGGLTEDYAVCHCAGVEETHALAVKASKGIERVTDFNSKHSAQSAKKDATAPANGTSEQPNEQTSANDAPAKPLDVVFIMIDAVSRPHFFRALPKTVEMLRTIRQDPKLAVFDFEFLQILGAFSPPNRWAAFSGHPPFFADVKFDGSPFNSFPESFNNVETNKEPDSWMWDYFANRGYVTHSARDMCSKLSKFVYGEYITRPWTDTHFQEYFCDKRLRFTESSNSRCIAPFHAHELTMNSGRRFREIHRGYPQFVYLDFIEGHEPSRKLLRAMDTGLPELLQDMASDHNTLVVLVSDHGIGDRGRCPSVRLEERNPMFFLIAPKHILTPEIEAALTLNQKRVLTPVTLFETVARVARQHATGIALDAETSIRPWSKSLWQQLPNDGCKEAGVSIKACVCSAFGSSDPSVPPLRW